jgi:hypothetical protein
MTLPVSISALREADPVGQLLLADLLIPAMFPAEMVAAAVAAAALPRYRFTGWLRINSARRG